MASFTGFDFGLTRKSMDMYFSCSIFVLASNSYKTLTME